MNVEKEQSQTDTDEDVEVYNNFNVLSFIDELSPLPQAHQKKVAKHLVSAMFPELSIVMHEPVKPQPPKPLFDPDSIVIKLSDSENYPSQEIRESDQEMLDSYYQAEEMYKNECDIYDKKKKEYDNFKKRQKKLFIASKKYTEGKINWAAILEYYQTSTYLKYVLETQAILIKRYLKEDKSNDSVHVKNFKKAVPNMVEFYYLFGKASLCFSKVVEDEVEVMDPLQIVNTQLLLPSTVSYPFFGEDVYKRYRELGWKDWDPVNYVDVMTLPKVQSSVGEGKKLMNAKDIRMNYSTLATAQVLSSRFNLEYTIPVVGRKSLMQEKLGYLGGDAPFVADNLWLLATLELLQNIIVVTAKNLNSFHVKDPSLGLDSAFETDYDVERDEIQTTMDDITDEGNMSMFTTSSNAELRVNTIPSDHLQNTYDNILRQFLSRWGMDVPEERSGTSKGSKKSPYKQEYWINNVATFVWEKYCKILCAMNEISTAERDKMLAEGVFNRYPRIDLRDPDEINGQKVIFDSLAVSGNATTDSKKALALELFGLNVTFEKEKEPTTLGGSTNSGPLK